MSTPRAIRCTRDVARQVCCLRGTRAWSVSMGEWVVCVGVEVVGCLCLSSVLECVTSCLWLWCCLLVVLALTLLSDFLRLCSPLLAAGLVLGLCRQFIHSSASSAYTVCPHKAITIKCVCPAPTRPSITRPTPTRTPEDTYTYVHTRRHAAPPIPPHPHTAHRTRPPPRRAICCLLAICHPSGIWSGGHPDPASAREGHLLESGRHLASGVSHAPAVDNDFRYRRCLPASRCCLHTHTSRKSTPLCRIVMTALDPAARARPDRATLGWRAPPSGGVALARACEERDGWTSTLRDCGLPAGRVSTASGPHPHPLMRPAGSPYVGCLLASVARRLGAACVPPLPSFLTRTPDRVRRRVMGQHKATASNTRAGSTVVGQTYRIRSKTGQSRARSRRHDDPGETDGQDRGSDAATRADISLLLPELRADANLHQRSQWLVL
jgi:hypothetical protein